MKKFVKLLFIFLICFMFNTMDVFADVTDYIPHKMIVHVESDLSSNNPPSSFTAIINDNYEIKDVMDVEKGTKLYLEATKVNKETRAKRDASIEARIVKIYVPSENKTIEVKNPKAIVRFSKYDKSAVGNAVVNTGITVANHFVKNITYPAHFAKGVIQDKENNRVKSGVKEVYDSSFISYVEKGEALDLHAGDLATLIFYTKNYQRKTEKATSD